MTEQDPKYNRHDGDQPDSQKSREPIDEHGLPEDHRPPFDHRHPADKKEHENLDLKEVVRIHGPVEAEVIKNFLESQGIPCFFKGLMLQTIYPFSADGLGEIKIYVPAKDYDVAKELLENRE